MLAAGDKVLVGVSGGPDSLALLHILWRLREELDLELMVAHLDHMLRGRGIPGCPACGENSLFSGDTGGHRAGGCGCLSGGARGFPGGCRPGVRYNLFIKAAQKGRCQKIALGHNLDDQAETVLMRLLRGTGLAGLGDSRSARWRNGYYSPPIEVSRAEIWPTAGGGLEPPVGLDQRGAHLPA